MLGNRRPQRNGGVSDSFKSTADKAAEEMRRLNLEGSDDNGGVGYEPGSYPDRPGEPDCRYYLRTGTCGYGSNCRFNHPSNGHTDGVTDTGELPERVGQPDCGHYLKTGTCKYGSTCKYNHPKDKQFDSPVFPNVLGLPMRQDARTCNYYMRTGFCKYGYACKFHHPQPASDANAFPAVEPVVYGSGSTAVVPTSDALSGGEHPTASLSNNAFFSSQLPQTYMPVILPLSQGWNTYMGSFGPYPVTSMVATPSSSGQLPASYLPDRPDQPECRYFMNYGVCKYGAVCKYHHPREKISELASSSFGPLGLPLRPGQPVCSHYTQYGICKYGPKCKFDHPLDGYSFAYSLGVPPLAIPFSSSPTHQRALPLVPSSETSPSEPSAKLREWSKVGENADNEPPSPSGSKTPEDSPEPSDSLPNSHGSS